MEVVLHDAMDNICQYLNVKDLSCVARLCKSWNSAAMRQIKKRCYPQRLSIYYNLSDLANTEHEFLNKLTVKPHIAIFFLETKLQVKIDLASGYGSCSKNDLLESYRERFPTIIGLEVQQILVEEDALNNSTDLQNKITLKPMGNSGLLGLFLPVHRQVHVHVTSSSPCCTPSINEVANKMIDNLKLYESDNTDSTIILFGWFSNGDSISKKIIRVVRKRFENQNITMWGGVFDKQVSVTHRQKKTTHSQKSVIGLRISGPSVESWTLTIDCSRKKQELDQKLYLFKEKIRKKRCTFGLVYGPTKIGFHSQDSYNRGIEVMRTITKIFSGISFTGLFNHNCRILCGDDYASCQDSNKYKLMSILIVAFD